MQILNAKPSCVVPTAAFWSRARRSIVARNFAIFLRLVRLWLKSRAFFDRTPHDTYVCSSITLQLPFMVSAISSAIWLPMTFIRKSYDKHIVRLTWTRLKYGVPFEPLAISSLAFLYKNKNASFSHENSKRFWNLLVLKNAWLEIARVRGRGSEISPSPSHSRSLPLAFLFLNKRARLEIANGPNGTPY